VPQGRVICVHRCRGHPGTLLTQIPASDVARNGSSAVHESVTFGSVTGVCPSVCALFPVARYFSSRPKPAGRRWRHRAKDELATRSTASVCSPPTGRRPQPGFRAESDPLFSWLEGPEAIAATDIMRSAPPGLCVVPVEQRRQKFAVSLPRRVSTRHRRRWFAATAPLSLALGMSRSRYRHRVPEQWRTPISARGEAFGGLIDRVFPPSPACSSAHWRRSLLQ